MRDYRKDRPKIFMQMSGIGPAYAPSPKVIGMPLHEQIFNSLDTGLTQIQGGVSEFYDGDSSEVTPEASFGMTRIDRIEYARSRGFDAKASEMFASITNAPSSVVPADATSPQEDKSDSKEGSKSE